MIEETQATASYIASLFTPALSPAFIDALAQLLQTRYQGHWHLDDPERGSGYRCLAQTGSDRPEALVKQALQLAAQSGSVAARIPRWTVFCDPGCVSARLGESSEWGSLQEVWGTLPTFNKPEPSPTDLTAVDNLPNFSSPHKRGSKAIQIVRPESRQAQVPVTPGANVAIIPPTPATARPAQPVFAPVVVDRSVTPTVADPFVRPSSRSSSSESSDGGHSSDRGSEIGSVFSATSHETLWPAHVGFGGMTHGSPSKRSSVISHHRHTSSVSTTASSNSTGTSASSISRPTSAASGSIVQEHSNGKVGVLGGGVLLGMPQSSTSGDESSVPMGGHSGMAGRRPRGRGRSRARSANFHAQQQQQQAMMSGRWHEAAALAF